METGRYGIYGGQYVPETLMSAIQELETAYEGFKKDPVFQEELEDLLANYAGRPSLHNWPEGPRVLPEIQGPF